MKSHKGTKKVCSRGHVFYKSSDCPVCPVCWPSHQKKLQSDFPKLSAPALRALHNAKISTLTQLAKYSEEQILDLHGMGAGSIPKLRMALKSKHLSFRSKKRVIKVKDGAKCKVIAGTHAGKSGIIQDTNISKTGAITITVLQANGIRFKTIAKNVEVA